MENIEEKVLELVGKQTGIDPKHIPLNRKFEVKDTLTEEEKKEFWKEYQDLLDKYNKRK